ncbi:MAG: hypothetical protein MHM6MM_008459 [Cercozoa sp. M6MM]
MAKGKSSAKVRNKRANKVKRTKFREEFRKVRDKKLEAGEHRTQVEKRRVLASSRAEDVRKAEKMQRKKQKAKAGKRRTETEDTELGQHGAFATVLEHTQPEETTHAAETPDAEAETVASAAQNRQSDIESESESESSDDEISAIAQRVMSARRTVMSLAERREQAAKAIRESANLITADPARHLAIESARLESYLGRFALSRAPQRNSKAKRGESEGESEGEESEGEGEESERSERAAEQNNADSDEVIAQTALTALCDVLRDVIPVATLSFKGTLVCLREHLCD